MKSSSAKHLSLFAAITGFILLIPLVAMQYTEEVNWTGSDFVFMGILLFGSGLLYELTTRNMTSRSHRTVVGVAVVIVMLFIWGAAATGFATE